MSVKPPSPAKPDSHDNENAPRKRSSKRAPYHPPGVKEYGLVAKLTMTKSLDFTDGSSSMSMLP